MMIEGPVRSFSSFGGASIDASEKITLCGDLFTAGVFYLKRVGFPEPFFQIPEGMRLHFLGVKLFNMTNAVVQTNTVYGIIMKIEPDLQPPTALNYECPDGLSQFRWSLPALGNLEIPMDTTIVAGLNGIKNMPAIKTTTGSTVIAYFNCRLLTGVSYPTP